MPHIPSVTRRPRLPALALALLALAGCTKGGTPSGQVVATVDGEEITRRDVDAEALASGTASDARTQPLLVARIVDRRLLVHQAVADELDRSPDFVARLQRGREMLLAQMVTTRWGAATDPADVVAVRSFIDANPQMFGERRVLEVDQIRVDRPLADADELAKLPGLDAVAGALTARHIPFRRAPLEVDTALADRDAAARAKATPRGRPFVIAAGGTTTLNVVTGARDAAVPPARREAAAAEAMARQASDRTLADRLAALRREATVRYQPGFAPPGAAR